MNWGYKLLFTFIVFIGGMGYLVYRSMSTDFELVEKEYYKSELKYQDVIEGAHQASLLSQQVQLHQSGDSLQLRFPEGFQSGDISGTAWFYCAYDSKRDQQLKLAPDANGVQHVDMHRLAPGNYTVKLQWKGNNTSFYNELPLTIN